MNKKNCHNYDEGIHVPMLFHWLDVYSPIYTGVLTRIRFACEWIAIRVAQPTSIRWVGIWIESQPGLGARVNTAYDV